MSEARKARARILRIRHYVIEGKTMEYEGKKMKTECKFMKHKLDPLRR